MPPGIRRRHARGCPAERTDDLDVCACRPAYQAQAGPRTARQTKTFPTLAAAKAWKRDVDRAHERGELTGDRAPTLHEAAGGWLDLAERGVVLARGDRPYRPSTLRGYRRSLEAELLPEFGTRRLDTLKRGELNGYVQRLQVRGIAASTVRNVVVPLRAIYRHALDLEQVATNPTVGLRVPAGSGRRTRVAAPREIGPLLDALHPHDRALWATAVYAGLRRGELMALRWADVDLATGTITVRLSYDPGSGETGPVKTSAGQDRRIAIAAVLRDLLLEHRQRAGARPAGLVFARGTLAEQRRRDTNAALPFSDRSVGDRAAAAWTKGRVAPITLHEGRHTFASLLIAASVRANKFNPKALQEALGHASIQQTYDRYGHLFPGSHIEVGRMLDAYLEHETQERPEVTQGVTWEQAEPALPSVTSTDGARCERPASVQRTPRIETA